jgi:IS30 family transposase
MINKKTHIKKEERFFIEKMLKINKTITEIAKLLERGVSSISEEISRNGGVSNYNSTTAEFQAKERQINKKLYQNKVIKNKRIKVVVEKYLTQGLSPEKISLTLKQKKSKQLYVSAKSIRKYINTLNHKLQP